MSETANKLRVWWDPQVGHGNEPFYIPVASPEEGKKVLEILAAYDIYQEHSHVKPDYANAGGLEMLDEDGEWMDWESNYGEDVDEYCASDECEQKEELQAFRDEVFDQFPWMKSAWYKKQHGDDVSLTDDDLAGIPCDDKGMEQQSQ